MNILLSVNGFKRPIPLEDQLSFVKYAQFDGIDYVAKPIDLFKIPKKLLTLSARHNVPIKAVHIPIVFIFYTPTLLNKKVLQLLNRFPDAEILNVHLSGFFNPVLRFGCDVKDFHKMAQRHNVTVSYESNPYRYYIKLCPKQTYEPEAFAQFCIENKLPMNLDTSHIASFDYDIVEYYKKYHKHINLLHLSDYVEKTEHLPFGKGTLPLIELFKELKKKNYNGTVIFEIIEFPKQATLMDIQEELLTSILLFKKFAM